MKKLNTCKESNPLSFAQQRLWFFEQLELKDFGCRIGCTGWHMCGTFHRDGRGTVEDSESGWGTRIEDMASDYIQEIQTIQPNGSYDRATSTRLNQT